MEQEQSDSKRLSYIEKKIDGLTNVVNDIHIRFNELSSHLFGNRRLDRDDEGTIGKIQDDIELLSKGHEEIKNEIRKKEPSQYKTEIYVKILWLCAGVVATAIFTLWLQHRK